MTTPMLGTVSCPKADALIYPATAQNLTTLASAIPEIFKDMQNRKVGHVTLTTPLLGTASYRRAVTCHDKPKPSHQI